MRVLVTGASGFTGRFMMEFLALQRGVEPVGLVRTPPPSNISLPRVRYETSDLLDKNHLNEILSSVSPDTIIHLAGLTHGNYTDLIATNVTGTKNLLDAGILANPYCRILVVSSSAIYGYAGEAPIPETAPFRPVSDYGRSKAEQETLALKYAGRNTDIAIARPFNLAGPGLPDTFVCGRIVKQVIEIGQKKRTSIELREIISSRDLIDVRDVVRGYWALVSRADFTSDCAGNAFNLGSGNAYPLSMVIALVEEITGKIYKVQLPKEHPEIPVMSQRSDNSRITSLTGWKPEISLKQTLADMIEAAKGKSV